MSINIGTSVMVFFSSTIFFSCKLATLIVIAKKHRMWKRMMASSKVCFSFANFPNDFTAAAVLDHFNNEKQRNNTNLGCAQNAVRGLSGIQLTSGFVWLLCSVDASIQHFPTTGHCLSVHHGTHCNTRQEQSTLE